MAQFGRALRSGRRGRGFKSRHLDQPLILNYFNVCDIVINSGVTAFFLNFKENYYVKKIFGFFYNCNYDFFIVCLRK